MQHTGGCRVHPYVLLLLATSAVGAAMAGALAVRDDVEGASRRIAFILAATALWSLLLALACLAPDAERALRTLRALGFAYLWIGPLCLHLALRMRSDLRPRLGPALALAYAAALAIALLHLLTPWFVTRAVPTSWGFAYRLGPGMLLAYGATAGAAALACHAVVGRGRAQPGEGQPRQAPILAFALALPLGLVTLTDVALPVFDVSAPPVGPTCITFLGGGIWLAAHRMGLGTRGTATFAREILGALPEGVVLLRGRDTIRTVNPAFAALAGCPPSELVGRSLGALLPEPAQRRAAIAPLEYETLLHRPDGGAVPVLVTTVPLRDRRGDPVGHVQVVRDQREVLALRRQLVTSARQAAVGEMAAGIAHEVNNPLAFIQANLNLLDHRLAEVGDALADAGAMDRPEAPARARMTRARDAVGRVASIVREVRGFAHAGSGRREPHDVNELLESTVRLVTPRLRGRAQVERRYGDLPPIPCVGQDVKQVFLSLLVDAAESVGEGGVIRLATSLEPGFVRVDVEPRGGAAGAGRARRREDGPGEVREGAALGLAVADQVVRDHGGEIGIARDGAGGTRVRIRLPLTAAAPGAEAPEAEEAACIPAF